MCLVDDAEAEGASPVDGKLRTAIRLLENRQRILFLLLTTERIAVGFCDLLVAAAMYTLSLLWQGRSQAHHVWWMPKTILSTALITAIL